MNSTYENGLLTRRVSLPHCNCISILHCIEHCLTAIVWAQPTIGFRGEFGFEFRADSWTWVG